VSKVDWVIRILRRSDADEKRSINVIRCVNYVYFYISDPYAIAIPLYTGDLAPLNHSIAMNYIWEGELEEEAGLHLQSTSCRKTP